MEKYSRKLKKIVNKNCRVICFSSRLQNLKLRITCAYVCNTFSGKPTKQTCKKCSICSVGQRELTPCNLTHDRICGRCEKGFYGSNETGCKPCSACCNDKDDVRISDDDVKCIKCSRGKEKQDCTQSLDHHDNYYQM